MWQVCGQSCLSPVGLEHEELPQAEAENAGPALSAGCAPHAGLHTLGPLPPLLTRH